MAFKKNVVKADLRSYPPYLIMGEKKIGKTSLFRNLVLFNFKSYDKGLLISFLDEEGYHALSEIQVERINKWDMETDENDERGMVQLVDDLIENKSSHGIEMIAFDTLDKMVEVATQEVFEIHRRLKGSYPESLNGALGGYGAGARKVVELIQEQTGRLRDAGYAIFILAHTKRKDKLDVLTGENYEQITNNLMSTFYNPIADTCQMIVNIIAEREYSPDGTMEYDNKGKEVGARNRVTTTKRMMYFRDCSVVDAGSRFSDLPEKLELSAENFMKAFTIGVKSEMELGVTDEDVASRAKEEETHIKENVEKAQQALKSRKKIEEEITQKREMFAIFQSKAKELGAEKLTMLKSVNEEFGVTKESIRDVDSLPMELLEKYMEIIK